MEIKTEELIKPLPVAKYKVGDVVKLSYDGELYPVTIKSFTVIGFIKEYTVEYTDGTKNNVRESEFENLLN
jgi:hypothetical protein